MLAGNRGAARVIEGNSKGQPIRKRLAGRRLLGRAYRKGYERVGATNPTRRVRGRPTAGYMTTICDEKYGLTDGWNYVKVVVGSNLRADLRMKSGH